MNFTATIPDPLSPPSLPTHTPTHPPTTHPPPPHTHTRQPELFEMSFDGSPAGRGRTGCLPCPDRQSGHSGAPCSRSSIQSLRCRLSTILRRLPDVLHFFDTLAPDPEQVIEVPKILLDDVPMRTVVRDTQQAERLVAVPTIVSFSSLQRTVEQHVDIPVPGGGGRLAGVQSSPPEQSPTTPSAQIVDIPVSGGGLQGFRPGQGSSSSHFPAGVHEDLDVPGVGVFANLKKKCGVRSLPEPEGARQVELMDSGGLRPGYFGRRRDD